MTVKQKARRARRFPKLPWPVVVILLITIPAVAIFGPAAIGIAGAFGAIGLPILLPIFIMALAIVGLVTLIISVRRKPSASSYLLPIIERIVQDEALRRIRKDLREAMVAEPAEPRREPMSGNRTAVRQRLLRMRPLEFECHVMGFFQEAGLVAWVTQQSNDAGVDGFGKHPEGLIVVQCKRYAAENCVGRPTIQQFKGVVEENGAWRGYIVTTGHFSGGAFQSADKNEKLYLIDLDGLLDWHEKGFEL